MFPPLSENGFRELSVEETLVSGALEGFLAGAAEMDTIRP
jgi:hypothetical protein